MSARKPFNAGWEAARRYYDPDCGPSIEVKNPDDGYIKFWLSKQIVNYLTEDGPALFREMVDDLSEPPADVREALEYLFRMGRVEYGRKGRMWSVKK